jgi:hypothetical protein
MSAAQGAVSIEISRRSNTDGSLVTVNARLLTPELKELIERQNVDCADINSMKWPLFGWSRHATCKLLLTQRDLLTLSALSTDPEVWFNAEYASGNFDFGYLIWFIVGSKAQSVKTAFSRMRIAQIQPLMISQFGLPNFGEAFYIVTFKCDRWAGRGKRAFMKVFEAPLSSEPNENFYPRSWKQDEYVNGSQLDSLTIKQIFARFHSFGDPIWLPWLRQPNQAPGYPQPNYWDMAPDGAASDVFDDSAAENYKYDEIYPPISVGDLTQKPLLVVADDVAVKASIALAYKPNYATEQEVGSYQMGKYLWSAIDIAKGNDRMVSFLNEYKNDIIAGSVYDIVSGSDDPEGNPTSLALEGIASIARIPNLISQQVRPDRLVVDYRRTDLADGSPPNVFADSKFETDFPLRQYHKYLSNPFDRTVPSRKYQGFINYSGQSCGAYISADNWQGATRTEKQFFKDVINSNLPSHVRDVNDRYNEKYQSGACDIWFRSWIMPNNDQIWAGGSWIELRLQMDGKGFAFPTTRIYGSFDDPILGPVTDDSQHEIESSGLVKTWRGEDGRLRVHVGQPFGIPCLLRIVSNEPEGDNVWRYTAKIALKSNQLQNPHTFKGLIAKFEEVQNTTLDGEPEITAFNLCEVNNSAGFAGPGYKLPLVQDGFRVLPIGEDRDGVLHEVVVQAMLYKDTSDNEQYAYFCLHNAIDGECDTSAFVEPTYDGGTFDGGA